MYYLALWSSFHWCDFSSTGPFISPPFRAVQVTLLSAGSRILASLRPYSVPHPQLFPAVAAISLEKHLPVIQLSFSSISTEWLGADAWTHPGCSQWCNVAWTRLKDLHNRNGVSFMIKNSLFYSSCRFYNPCIPYASKYVNSWSPHSCACRTSRSRSSPWVLCFHNFVTISALSLGFPLVFGARLRGFAHWAGRALLRVVTDVRRWRPGVQSMFQFIPKVRVRCRTQELPLILYSGTSSCWSGFGLF